MSPALSPDMIGSSLEVPPAGYGCDGCDDAHVPMCGAGGWLHLALAFPCACEAVTVRHVHLCPTCAQDPEVVSTLQRGELPGQVEEVPRGRHLRLVAG